MNVKDALAELSKIHEPETRLLIDCPHCGRSGELGSIRQMAVVGVGVFSAQHTLAAQKQYDAELHEIANALSLRWPVSVQDIVKRVSELTNHEIGI
jgi:hypothetical protein